MKILITGFEPFGGETINPAYEAVRKLPDRIEGAEIIKKEIPTVFSESTEILEKEIQNSEPDAILCVGQAGGRSCVTVEKVAINLADARIPDNAGDQPVDQKLREDGENAYFATVPVKKIVENIRKHGLPCHISYSAGTFVCNCIMYQALYLSEKKYPGISAGFIHVPYLPEQVITKSGSIPFMSLEQITSSLYHAVETVVWEKMGKK